MSGRHLKPGSSAGGSTTKPSDAVLQFARVGASTLGRGTSAPLYNVEGAGGQPSRGMDVYGQIGLVVRPPSPDETGGRDRHADVLCVVTSDGLVPVAGRDVRLNQFFPNPATGDVVLVGYGCNFVKLGIDGRICVVTTDDGTPNGRLIQLQMASDGLAFLGPWGKITYAEDGFHLLHFSGARIDLGGIGGLPAPFDLLGSHATIGADVLRLRAAVVAAGLGGASEPVAKAQTLQGVLGTVGTALGLVSTALTNIETDLAALGPPVPTSGPSVTAAVAALATAVGAISAGAATIPSTSLTAD